MTAPRSHAKSPLIVALLGSAFTSAGTQPTNPDSARAQQVLADNFSTGERIDDAVVVHSAALTTEDPVFKAFVQELRSSIRATVRPAPSGIPTRQVSRASPRTATRRW